MIKQLSDKTFIFNYKKYKPIKEYYDSKRQPYSFLSSDITVHDYLPTYKIIEENELNWLDENNVDYKIENNFNLLIAKITIKNKSDAMAFKLKWL